MTGLSSNILSIFIPVHTSSNKNAHTKSYHVKDLVCAHLISPVLRLKKTYGEDVVDFPLI